MRIAFCRALALALLAPAPGLHADTTGTLSSVYHFTNADGSSPGGLIRGAEGNLYGTTLAGGGSDVFGYGTVFELTPGGALTTLVAFDNKDGDAPNNLVQGGDGNFYGTTAGGGDAYNGVVFKLTPSGTLTTLHDFSATDGNDLNADGVNPGSFIPGRDGSFYGTTVEGGAHGAGVVFRISADGKFSVLCSFDAPAANSLSYYIASSSATLIQGNDGNLYGTTAYGGVHGVGMVFRVTPGGTLTVLHSFSAPDSKRLNAEGFTPVTRLAQGRDGKFYGTTFEGGDGPGTAFAITPDGALTVLNRFAEDQTNSTPGGADASGLVQGQDGNFYGTLPYGGTEHAGAVFQLTPTGVLTILASFDPDANGERPGGFSFQDADGVLYGVAGEGGGGFVPGNGTVFAVSVQTVAATVPAASLAATVPRAVVGTGVGEVTVSLSAAATSKVIVHYRLGGSAVNGADYARLSGTVKIKPGKTSQVIQIVPQGDQDDTEKAVKVSLTAGAGYTVGSAAPVKVKLVGATP